MTINIPAGCSRKIEIIYEDGTDWASVDLSKKDPSVNRLRKLSDFRDVTLSRNFVGRIIVAIYYDSGAYQLGMKKLILIALVLLALFVISARIFFRWYRKTRARELKIVYSVMKISFLL